VVKVSRGDYNHPSLERPGEALDGCALNVTAVITIATRSALWVAADRRLTDKELGNVSDAVKVTRIHTPDGVALLTYTGIGRVSDRQISLWVYRTLRGIQGISLVQSLEYVARRAKLRFRKHIWAIGKDRHIFLAAASVGRSFWNIEIDITQEPPQLIFHGVRRSTDVDLKIIGAGQNYLSKETDLKMWDLYYYIQKYECGQISAQVIASKLAEIIVKLSERARNSGDTRISPESLVVMERLKTSPKYKNISQEQVPVYWCFDAHGEYVAENIVIPCIINGIGASDIFIRGYLAARKWAFKGPLNVVDLFGPVPNEPDDRL
jgi:hypothetical protein